MIKVENVVKTFDSGGGQVDALRGVSLHVKKGEIFGIIGVSGAGKSTLIRCLTALETPDEGRVEINGLELGSLKEEGLSKLRKDMGVVFQGYNLLYQRTVFENVAFPLTLGRGFSPRINNEERKRVKEMLELVGLEDKCESYPSQLSGGQKQRVAIARAIVTNPQVLICDEPTGALDTITTKSLLRLLKELNSRLSITIAIVTHNIDVVRSICDHLVVLHEGLIVERGDTGEVFSNPKTEVTRQLIGEGGF